VSTIRLKRNPRGKYPNLINPVEISPGKRVFDIVVSILALIFIFPVMAIIAIAIWLDSPGPPLFIHDRIGRNGEVFRMFKFRTMQRDHNPERDKAHMKEYVAGMKDNSLRDIQRPIYKSPGCGHITRVGDILRKSSLDELPQLINILRGEMSLVGPRPNLPWEVEEYQDWHFQRLAVRPGLTGLAQVNGRSALPFDELVEWDLRYIGNMNLRQDLKILWRTVGVVLSAEAAG
jgi:lipopolysaccharide/colanic/teichoic acid biosynthesis glycosyltransferase